MIMTKNENLMKLITTYDGRDIDLCYYVFEHLKSMSKEDSVQGLKLFFEEIKKYRHSLVEQRYLSQSYLLCLLSFV